MRGGGTYVNKLVIDSSRRTSRPRRVKPDRKQKTESGSVGQHTTNRSPVARNIFACNTKGDVPMGALEVARPKIKSLGHRYEHSLYFPGFIPIGLSLAKFAAS